LEVRRHFFPDVILYRDDILRFCLCEIEGVEVPDPGQLYYGFQVVVDAQVYGPVVATAVAATFPGSGGRELGSTWRSIILALPVPMVRAASTQSGPLTVRTWAHVILTNAEMKPMPIRHFGPRT
jgi:hypothetical protein